MKKTTTTITIPENIQFSISNNTIKITGPKGVCIRNFVYPKINISSDGKDIIISCKDAKKKDIAMIGTIKGHIKNMILGVTDGIVYKLKVLYSHFPVKITYNKDTKILSIENFLGEKKHRSVKLFGNINTEISHNIITLTGCNIEEVSQNAANIESVTKIKNRDRRVFQDGIYIIQKC